MASTSCERGAPLVSIPISPEESKLIRVIPPWPEGSSTCIPTCSPQWFGTSHTHHSRLPYKTGSWTPPHIYWRHIPATIPANSLTHLLRRPIATKCTSSPPYSWVISSLLNAHNSHMYETVLLPLDSVCSYTGPPNYTVRIQILLKKQRLVPGCPGWSHINCL